MYFFASKILGHVVLYFLQTSKTGMSSLKMFFSLRGYQIFSLGAEIFPCHNTKGEISQSVRFFYFEISAEIENENCEEKNNKKIKNIIYDSS